MNKIKITLLFSIAGTLFISPVFAAMSYPTIAGITLSNSTSAAEVIIYFFSLAVAFGTFMAAVVLAMAGFDYVSSRGEPARLEEAKNKIKNAFLGLIVLLSAFMILNIINPQLTNIAINTLPKNVNQEVTIPEGVGVYLYDSPNFVSTKDPLRIIETTPSFLSDGFHNKVQSIKFVNPKDYKFGAILFSDYINGSELISGSDLRGNCSYALNNIADLDNSLGNENNPPTKKNNLSSIVVFKTSEGSPSVKIYNTISCKKKSDDYGKQEEKNNVCTISGSNGFKDIKESCPDFKGDILSIETTSNVGVLLKAGGKAEAGRCQFFESNDNGCINTVGSSFVYSLSQQNVETSVKPQSFIVFPLVK